jgi:hypothetical protein
MNDTDCRAGTCIIVELPASALSISAQHNLKFMPLGRTSDKVLQFIHCGVAECVSRAPLNTRKNSAIAKRNSMYARCVPIQAREPVPNGWKAFLASLDTSSLTQREGRYLRACVRDYEGDFGLDLHLLKRLGKQIRIPVGGV